MVVKNGKNALARRALDAARGLEKKACAHIKVRWKGQPGSFRNWENKKTTPLPKWTMEATGPIKNVLGKSQQKPRRVWGRGKKGTITWRSQG